MSDRTQASVRTGTRTENDAATNAAGTDQPVSATQSIPTGSNRAVQGNPAGGAVPPAGNAPATGAAPRTAAAGTKSPGSKTSGAKAPGSKAPGSKTPGSKAPGAKAPQAPASTKGTSKTSGRGPRRARLQLRHIDTWSAFKISFVLSIALFFIWMVAVGVLYGVLSGLGVFDTLNGLFGQLGTVSDDSSSVVITPGVVFGAAAVIGAINVILLTALGTVATFIYNLSSDLVGGLELTLSERD